MFKIEKNKGDHRQYKTGEHKRNTTYLGGVSGCECALQTKLHIQAMIEENEWKASVNEISYIFKISWALGSTFCKQIFNK